MLLLLLSSSLLHSLVVSSFEMFIFFRVLASLHSKIPMACRKALLKTQEQSLRSIFFCISNKQKATLQCLVEQRNRNQHNCRCCYKKEMQAKSPREILIHITRMESLTLGPNQKRQRIWNSVFGKHQKSQKKHCNTKPRLAKLSFKQLLGDLAICRMHNLYKLIIVHYYMLKPADTMNSNSEYKEYLMSPFNRAILSLLILHQ